MATARTAKVQAEIDKTRAKLAEQQNKLKELETKLTELENTEIVDIVRGMSIPLDNLAAILQSIKGVAAPASGQVGPKNTPVKNATNTEDDTE